MCWNKTVSAIALGVGFFFNILGIILINDIYFTCISIIFLFVLFMQLAELLSYISYDRKNGIIYNKNSSLMRFATQLALIANMGQPIIATMALLPYSPVRIEYKMFAVFILFLYGVYTCYAASVLMDKYTVISKNLSFDNDEYTHKPCISKLPHYQMPHTWGEYCTNVWGNYGGHKANMWGKQLEYHISKLLETCFGDKQEDCHSHIVYPWWRQVSPAPYIIALAAAMIFLLRPISYLIYQLITIFGLLIISVAVFNDGEVGSQWCLGTVFLCLLNPIMWYILVKRPLHFAVSYS